MRGRSVRFRLCLFVAAILIPSLAAAGVVVVRAAEAHREQIVTSLREKAREVRDTVDREIVAAKNLLTVLASSRFLQNGELLEFEREALQISQQIGIQIVLRDSRTGHQVFNTSFPGQRSIPRGNPAVLAAEREAAAMKKAVVSNVFLATPRKEHVVVVVAPVIRNGAAELFLTMGIRTRRFADLLEAEQVESGAIVGLVDRNNVIVARSLRHEEYSGTAIPTEFAANASAAGGVWTSVSRLGVLNTWYYRRSVETGWFVAVGVPETVLSGPLKTSLAQFAGAGALLFALAMALTYQIGGRVERSLGAMGVDREPTREEFAVLFDSFPVGVVLVNGDGRIALTNAALQKRFGYRHEELVGKPIEAMLPAPSDGPREPEVRPLAPRRDVFGRHKNGDDIPVEIWWNRIGTRNGNFAVATVVDVTARKLAAERLSAALAERDELRRRLMQAFEAERLRLAHELHDQTGQSLTAVMLELKGIEQRMDDDGRGQLRSLRKQLELMGQSLHRIAWELRPASIDELGLAAAIENYVAEWSRTAGIEADFHCRSGCLDRVSDEIRTAIYRVVQEALTNVAKHARGATAVSIIVEHAETGLQLTVEDNGCGFDADDRLAGARHDAGLGLAGMRERLSLIGGNLIVESAVDLGTTLFARIPLEPANV